MIPSAAVRLTLLCVFLTLALQGADSIQLRAIDVHGHSMQGVIFAFSQRSGTSRPTDEFGKTEIPIAPNLPAGTAVELVISSPANISLVFIQPWQGKTNLPTDRLITVQLCKPGDPDILTELSAVFKLAAVINERTAALRSKGQERLKLSDPLNNVAETLGLSPQLIDKAIGQHPFNIKDSYSRGQRAYYRGDLAEAVTDFTLAVTVDDRSDVDVPLSSAYEFLGWSLMAQGKFSEAARNFEQSLSLNIDDQEAEESVLLAVAGIYLRQYDSKRAKSLLESYAQKHHENQDVLKLLTIVKLIQGDNSSSEQFCKDAKARGPGDAETSAHGFCEGIMQLLGREYKPAESSLRIAVGRLDPNDEDADLLRPSGAIAMGIAIMGQGRFDEGYQDLRQGLRRLITGKDDPQVTLAKAGVITIAIALVRDLNNKVVHQALTDLIAAQEHLLGKQHPLLASSLSLVADWLITQGYNAEAQRTLRRAAALYLAGKDPPLDYSFILAQQSRLEEAAKKRSVAGLLLDRALENIDRHPEADALISVSMIKQAASLLAGRKEYIRAAALYDRAIAVMSVQQVLDEHLLADLYHERGRINFDTSDFQGAKEYYEKALQHERLANGDRVERVAVFICNLASAHSQLKNYSQAESLLRWAVEIEENLYAESDPELGRTLHIFGTTLVDAGDILRGLVFLRRALSALERGNASDREWIVRTLDGLGSGYYSSAQYTEAKEAFSRAILICSDKSSNSYLLIELRRMLALVDLELNDFAGAERRCREAQELAKRYRDVFMSARVEVVKAHIMARRGLAAVQAQQLMRAAIRKEEGTNHPPAFGDLVRFADLLSQQQSASQEAETLYRRAIDLSYSHETGDSTPFPLIGLAALLHRQGRATEALNIEQRQLTTLKKSLRSTDPAIISLEEHLKVPHS
jgi:tetratricopeptide (TPR) repeat protein